MMLRKTDAARFLPVICATLLVSLTPACAKSDGKSVAMGNPATAFSAAAPLATAQALPDFSAMVDKYGGAVVNVVSTRELTATSGPRQWNSPQNPFSEFFRQFGMPFPGAPSDRSRSQAPLERGEGSGFIVGADGYILTNAHVVAHASQVTVKLRDRREFQAKVLGEDQRSDVAVLKIPASGLPTVRLGDSSKLRPGEWVVAIGAPFGFENSVTAGIVSATSRAVGSQTSIVPFIQTDVAVNPGNSGGPLFNMAGEVVGINSMIYSGTGGYQGVSFAIPIDVALEVKDQLVRTGHVTRGRIGVTVQEVNSQLADSFGLDRPRGALVSSVESGGPADSAGVKPGDVIVGVGDRQVELSSDLPGFIAHLAPGSSARLDVIRGGKSREMKVQIAELKEPHDGTQLARYGSSDPSKDAPQLGLAVRPMTADEAKDADTTSGLIVEDVSGPAAAAGVQPGDVILRAGDQVVKSAADLRKAASRSEHAMALLIQRGGNQIYVPIRLS